MNLSRGTVVYGVGLATACVLLAAGVHAQARPSGQPGGQKPQLSQMYADKKLSQDLSLRSD